MTLHLHDLAKAYGAVVVLQPTSLAVAAGQAVVLQGDNGAGKSTLLALCAGLCHPTAGTVTVTGQPPARARAHLGYLPEGPCFDPRQSVRGLLSLCVSLGGGDLPRTVHRLRLQDHLDAPLGALSRGLRQRVALAQALLHAPDLLLLDEPLTTLDESTLDLVVSALHEEKRRGTAMLIASHRASAFGGLFDRAAHLQQGRLSWT